MMNLFGKKGTSSRTRAGRSGEGGGVGSVGSGAVAVVASTLGLAGLRRCPTAALQAASIVAVGTTTSATVHHQHTTSSNVSSSSSRRASHTGAMAATTATSGISGATANVTSSSNSRSISGLSVGNSGAVAAGSVSGSTECPLCLLELPVAEFPDLNCCNHKACFDCLQQYLKIEISESRVNVTCPECAEAIHPNDIKMILNDDHIMSKYESFMLRRVLVAEPDARWCPAPDCGYVVIASGCAGCPKLQCSRPGCDTFFCYHCKHEWHPNQTCDAARAQRNNRLTPSRGSADFDGHSIHISQRDSDIKPCPTCKVLVIKMDDGSCNHMTCSVCGTEFCWLCMKQITDLHYLSPSGCTFWGKKPWSRKKKIMWQLGMLVGAPVGIALIAGIAVPAIIIGIPVWVGRKLHARFERQSMRRHKRNLLVASGVVSSVLVSPILAAVAIGIGVPILLAYVYGVVPISLCRSGGCGVNKSSSERKMELDEEAEIGSANSRNAPDGMSVDTALSTGRPNPSIGEMSYGMSGSVSMGSGSHLDRAGGDRESASNAPLAGSIASASNKLEVTAEVSSNKRYSFSSGHSEAVSCTVSLSERSANLSNYDDLSSVRGMAGSIISREHRTAGPNSVVTPVSDLGREEDSNQVASGTFETSPVETVITVEAQPLTSSSGTTRCVSFQSTAIGGPVPAKSRSYELLNSYCEVCHSSHRPCCPNFTTTVATATAPGKSSKSVMKSQTNNKQAQQASAKSSRKSSVKSTSSDASSSSNSCSTSSKSEQKRVLEQADSKLNRTISITSSSSQSNRVTGAAVESSSKARH